VGITPILGGLAMSLPELFLRESTNHDASMVALPQDLDLWPEVIAKHVREKFPHTKEMSLKVSFLKKNEEMGVATGSAEIAHTKLNKSIFVPIIIKNFKMHPLDIVMIPDKSKSGEFETLPLTKKCLEEYFFSNRVFDSLSKPLDKLKTFYRNSNENLMFPPRYRYSYASAQMIDSLDGSVDQKDIDSFKSVIEKNPDWLIGYEKRAHLDIIKKCLGVKVAAEKKEELIKNISIIKKDLKNKYKVVSVSDEAYSPIVQDIDEEELKGSLSDKVERPEDIIHEVEQNGERMVFNNLNPGPSIAVYGGGDRPENYVAPRDKIDDVKVLGCYKVQDKGGISHEGVVIPNVIDFNMKVLPYKIFVNKQKSGFQTKIMGMVVEDKHPMKEIPFSETAIGLTGTFVISNKKNALATIPVTILSMLREGSKDIIVGETLMGEKIKFKLHGAIFGKEDFAELSKIVKVDDHYILPSGFKFVAMEDITEFTEDPSSFALKTAASNIDSTPVRVIHTGHSQFAMRGPDMRKMAHKIGWDVTNLNPSQTVFLLAAKKCPLDKIAEALKSAGKNGESRIQGLPYVNWKKKKTCKKVSALEKDINKLKVNLLKEASFFDDSQVIDSVLSLNFINSENINKFINFIPLLEEVKKMLAQSLLACRLGMKEIPEHATAVAMQKLIEVVEGLEKLKLRLKEE